MDLPPAHFVKDEMQNRRLIVNGLNEIEKQKITNIQLGELDQFEPGHQIAYCVCFHPVGTIS